MEKINVNISLNESIKKIKDEQYANIKYSKVVNDFKIKYELDDKFIYDNSAKLTNWVNTLKNCQGCKGLSMCNKSDKGYFADLKYDKVLYTSIEKCKYLRKYEEEYSYIKNYIYSDLSKDQYDIRLADIKLEEKDKTYNKNVSDVVRFTKNPEKGLYLHGAPGHGKTYLAIGIANYFAKQDKSVAFVNFPTFMNKCKSNFGLLDKNITKLCKVDLLVLDDLGGEVVSTWSKDEVLYTILNYRMENKLITVFTSNYDYEELKEHYTNTNKGNYEPVSAIRLVERVKALSLPIQVIFSNRRV